MTQDSTSLTLLNRVRRRDPDAWNRLVDVYGPLVFAWCRRGGLSEHDAGDTGQEIFSDVARGIDSFRRPEKGGSFRGWLRIVTRNKIADFWRKQNEVARGGSGHAKELAELPEPELVTEPDPANEKRESQEICQRVLAYMSEHFSEQHWRAFWRTAIDEQSAAFVADELGMSEANVRQVKSRILRRLREELADLENFT